MATAYDPLCNFVFAYPNPDISSGQDADADEVQEKFAYISSLFPLSDEKICGWRLSRLTVNKRFPLSAMPPGLFAARKARTLATEPPPTEFLSGDPLYTQGFQKHRAQVWNALRAVQNLILLGRQGLFLHNNMDHTIYTGLRAAHCWTTEKDPVGAWYLKEVPEFAKFRIVD